MKKLFVVIICLFSMWAVMTACDDTSDPDSYTLSGDITAKFYTETPDNTVTINLMSENDCTGTPVYSDSSNAWRITKVTIADYERYSSYVLSGIEAGTYYLCGSIDGSDVSSSSSYGPVEIEISEDTELEIVFPNM